MPSSPYEPTTPLPRPVVGPGEFPFAVAHLDHGHIYGQTRGLIDAGGTFEYVYDSDLRRAEKFLEHFPGTSARVVTELDAILDDDAIRLVASAAIPNERGPLGCRVMQAGKDYFTDKCPFTSLDQLTEARAVAAATGRKYLVYYSERLHVESAIHAGRLIADGALGRIVHLAITGPHRHGTGRADWFYDKARYGGILTDICSHQVDQFLHYTDSLEGSVQHARVANFNHPDHPGFEDFGEAIFEISDGVSCHSRVDWFTPDGLQNWGDGRLFAIGTEGFLEIRKYLDLGRNDGGDRIYLADGNGEHIINCTGKVGFPFFGELILDCLHRTENAMTQAHAFRAAELSLQAQALADAKRTSV